MQKCSGERDIDKQPKQSASALDHVEAMLESASRRLQPKPFCSWALSETLNPNSKSLTPNPEPKP